MKTLLLLLLPSLIVSLHLQAALPGELDKTFLTGGGVDREIFAMARQKDGKIIIGGNFTSVQGVPRSGIARLMSNGTLDLSFDPGSGLNSNVLSIALMPDGRILIAGSFTTYAGAACIKIARLMPNGTLDPSFQRTAGPDGSVSVIKTDAAGKIYIGGNFSTFGASTRHGIAKLNSNGTLDLSFSPGAGIGNDYIFDLAVQEDGKIWIGGNFTSYNGTERNRVARLLASGALDTAFNPGVGANGGVNSVNLLPDGGALLGGDFTEYKGYARSGLIRVLGDGDVNLAANVGQATSGGGGGGVECVIPMPGGRFLVSGSFTHYNTQARVGLARIFADGSLDATFADVMGATAFGYALAALPDGGVLVGGSSNSNGKGQDGLYRVSAKGVVDTAFNFSRNMGPQIKKTLTLPDGKVIIAGDFSTYAPQPRSYLARLKVDGTPDLTFNKSGIGPDSVVYALARLSDGKLLIAGDFSQYNNIPRARLARLMPDGSLDLTFNAGGAGPNFSVFSMAILSDGKILIGGAFTTYNGASRPRIARLNSDGTLDVSFDPGSGPNAAVLALAVANDGSIYLGGSFGAVNGSIRNRIARLNSSGALHPSFVAGTGFDSSVISLCLDASQRLTVGGFFTSYKGLPAPYLVRIRSNGNLDDSFALGSGFNAPVIAVALQPDQRVLVAGAFNQYQGSSVKGFMRLNSDGSRDECFSSGLGSEFIEHIEIQPTGLALIAGQFVQYDGQTAYSIARVHTVLAPGGLMFRGITDTAGSKLESMLKLAGQFTLSTASSGIFSGKMVLGAESVSLVGSFDQRGKSFITAKRKDGSQLYLDLALIRTAAGAGVVTGMLRDASGTGINVEAPGPYYSKTRTATQSAGVYHVALGIPGDTAFQDAINPSAHGTLTATVNLMGAAKVAGRLSDGTTVTAALSADEYGTILLSPILYANRGLVNGRLILFPTYEDLERRRAVAASLVWLRPPNAPGGLYPQGFTTELINVDSSGLAPDLNALVPATSADPNTSVQVNLAGGHFSVAGLNGTVAITPKGASLPVVGGALPGLKLAINRATGTFTGSCTPPGASGVVSFSGVVVNSASGLGSCLVKVGNSTRISRISILKQ